MITFPVGAVPGEQRQRRHGDHADAQYPLVEFDPYSQRAAHRNWRLSAEAVSRPPALDDEVAAASTEMVSAIPAPSITTNVDGPMLTRRLDRGAEL
jgi:hypothetical protein